jgi:hypothetical protein
MEYDTIWQYNVVSKRIYYFSEFTFHQDRLDYEMVKICTTAVLIGESATTFFNF